eukprot:NODE_77_length_23806_cov_0.393892.p16 type:complete len:126 gc:universal NODE_77_length_23806_cov_0.393892:11979-12356(+)
MVWYYPPEQKLKLKQIALLARIESKLREKQYYIAIKDQEVLKVAHKDSLVLIDTPTDESIQSFQGECLDVLMDESIPSEDVQNGVTDDQMSILLIWFYLIYQKLWQDRQTISSTLFYNFCNNIFF